MRDDMQNAMMEELQSSHKELHGLVTQLHVKIIGAEEVDVTTTTEQ
jgi:hypothetical protein